MLFRSEPPSRRARFTIHLREHGSAVPRPRPGDNTGTQHSDDDRPDPAEIAKIRQRRNAKTVVGSLLLLSLLIQRLHSFLRPHCILETYQSLLCLFVWYMYLDNTTDSFIVKVLRAEQQSG